MEPDDSGIELVLRGCPTDGAPEWCATVELLLGDARRSVVVCDVAQLRGSAAAVLDALLRLQLTARRRGGAIELHGPPRALVELLRGTGLDAVLRVCERSGGESVGRVEEREQVRIDEDVDRDDASG